MRDHLVSYLDNTTTFLLLAIAGLTPVLFFNQTTEFFEMPKLIFLLVATTLALGLWIFSWIMKGKISISRTPLDVALLVMLVTVLASTYFSVTRTSAIFGNFPRVHGSAVAWVVYILLYFVTVSHLRSLKNIRSLMYVMYSSGIVVALVTLMSFFGLYLPFDFARAVNFTPTGSSFSTIAFLMMLLPLPVLSLISSNKYLPLPVSMTVAILFGVTIALIGSWPVYVLMGLVFAAALFVTRPSQIRKNITTFLIPTIVTALVLALAYVPFTGPLGALHNMENNFPKEIQLPFSVSWKVSASAFRDAPFFGTGPSSYVFNFTTYKPLEFNALSFWNFSFDTAYNEYLSVLGTLGAFGVGALILFTLVVLSAARRSLMARNYEGLEAEESPILVPALAISGVTALLLMAVHASTLVSLVMTLFVLASFMMAQRPVREKLMELSMGIRATTSDNRQFDLFPVVVFIVFVIIAVPVLFKTGTTVAADYYHRLALNESTKNGTLTYQYLQKAETLNPQIDLYRVDMAQTNFALANAIAAKKGPTKDNPQGSLTNQDKQTIQTLLAQAINEARVSVTLSPRSATNWEVLGSIYRNISGVAQNALAFSLDAYGQAIQRDSLNPALRVTVGGIYYAAKNYALATRFFSDAANLKPDYANAYYNLAITLRDNNDLTNAVVVAQQLVNIVSKNPKSADSQTANALLDDLKKKLANAQAQQQSEQQAPAAQTTSALQNPNLSNVTTLNNPPQVTPAPAVKPNPSANLPVVSPTPSK